MVKLVCGVGFNDRSRSGKVNGKYTKEYKLWWGVLERCYSLSFQIRQPTYVGCTISDNFKSFSFFHDWVQEQVGFGQKGYQLDKDILVKGNKVYSEDTCVFVPRELNNLFTKRENHRGVSPLGVNAARGRCQVQLSTFGKNRYLGTFPTYDLAFQAYKAAKEAHIKHMAELYKADIDPRAYAALMAYQVEITD